MYFIVIINLFGIPLGLSCFHRDISQIYPDLVHHCGYICLLAAVGLIFPDSHLFPLPVSPLAAWLSLLPA